MMEQLYNEDVNNDKIVTEDAVELNNLMNLCEFIVVHLNIRGFQTNFSYLEIFSENLACKPDVIVCSETHRLPCFTFYNLPNYVMYYNHGKINKSDDCVVYILIETGRRGPPEVRRLIATSQLEALWYKCHAGLQRP